MVSKKLRNLLLSTALAGTLTACGGGGGGGATGFVTDKYQGDGYYSQADGIHTVAYHVLATLTGSVKMQGSLATTPTESDWFDIADTTFTTDQSTTIFSSNFTGNFVWVRAKATGVTAGSVTKILYNH